jgi:hypothetical protein
MTGPVFIICFDLHRKICLDDVVWLALHIQLDPAVQNKLHFIPSIHEKTDHAGLNFAARAKIILQQNLCRDKDRR